MTKNKINSISSFFAYLSVKKFIEERTSLTYKSNLSCHIMGKTAGGNDKRTEVTAEEKEELKKSGIKFCSEALEFFKSW